MAPKKTSMFLVGLFVSLGMLIIMAFIIWIGASKYFKRGELYVTYLDESVQGLDKGSEVRFRGVKVGWVEAIRIAPDNRLVAVIMNIDIKDDLPQKTVARLQFTGITGIMFINLELRKPDESVVAPKIAFLTEYQVIPSQPSDIKRFFTSIEEIVKKFEGVDLQSVSQEIKATAQEIGAFFRNPDMKSAVANIKSSSKNVDNLTGKLNRSVTEAKINQIFTKTTDTVGGAQDFITGLRQQIQSINFPQIGTKTNRVLTNLEGTSDNLQSTSQSLELLIDRLYYRPSDILFGKPPKKRWNE